MTPSHTNKHGARYRYYISHAILQKRDTEAGSAVRASATEIESLVIKAVRSHLDQPTGEERDSPTNDRELIERHVLAIVIKPQAVEIRLINKSGQEPDNLDQEIIAGDDHAFLITAPRTPSASIATKGILHSPSSRAAIGADHRDALLAAIAKARSWIDDIVEGRANSFTEIAKQEGKVERHIRLLAPLAFVSPDTIAHIIDSTFPSVGVTELAKSVQYSWNPGRS